MKTEGLKALYGGRLDVLTARQADVLGFILGCVCRDGASPTVREVGEALGIKNPNGVHCHLRSLRSKGFVAPMDGGRIRLKGLRFRPEVADG